MEKFEIQKEWYDMMADLSSDVKLEIWNAIIEYGFNSVEIELSPIAKAVFPFIKKDIDSQVVKKQQIAERNRRNGCKGGRPIKTQKNPENPVGYLGNSGLFEEKQEEKSHTLKEELKEELEKPSSDGKKTATPLSIKERYDSFKAELSVYTPKYGEEMIDEFLLYWGEPDAKGKMRFEKEKTWSLGGRLSTWSRNNFNNTSKNTKKAAKISEAEKKYSLDWEKVAKSYNSLGVIPLVRWDEDRKIKFIDIIERFGKEKMAKAYSNIKSSKVLREEPLRDGTMAGFDFIFSEKVFAKILEGQFNPPETKVAVVGDYEFKK